MPFKIIRNDITRVRADAIVNTANPEPRCAAGTDAAIYRAAGEKELLWERQKIGRIAPGEAAITAAFRLPANYIIHTVGPAWIDGKHGEYDILRSCYKNSLMLADRLGCRSIAFPLIATGVYGFPKERALEIALSAIREHLENAGPEEADMDVTLVVFERDAYRTASGLTDQIEEYIDENYVAERIEKEYLESGRLRTMSSIDQTASSEDGAGEDSGYPVADEGIAFSSEPKTLSLEDRVSNLGESFQARLLRMIDERGMTDPEVYKRANVDRTLFSKIRCSENYIPKKKTIAALAIALRLNLDETKDLLASAGLVLTNNSKADVIVSFCIENGIYDIFEVNALLFKFDQPILG